MQILIIESETYLAQSLARKLENEGHICCVRMPNQNIQDDSEYDVVLLGSFFESAKLIKSYPNSVIIILANYLNSDITSALRAGANDYILKRANRGHTFEDVKKASKLIRWYGFKLGHQMMVGLPESTRIDEINTAKALVKLKPKMIRIYPVLVVKNTKLEEEYKQGIYEPLSVVQAVEICKEIVRIFADKKIDIIRIGLQNTDEISDPQNEKSEVVAGPYHPAFRQLVESGMWYDAIVGKIKKLNVKVKKVQVTVNPIDANNVIGHKKENVQKLKDIYDVDLVLKQDKNIKQGKSKIDITETYLD